MEEKKLSQEYQRAKKKEYCCRFCENRDKDMAEFYIIHIKGE